MDEPLIKALYAGAKALKKIDNEADATILRELARLLNDAEITDLKVLEEITQS